MNNSPLEHEAVLKLLETYAPECHRLSNEISRLISICHPLDDSLIEEQLESSRHADLWLRSLKNSTDKDLRENGASILKELQDAETQLLKLREKLRRKLLTQWGKALIRQKAYDLIRKALSHALGEPLAQPPLALDPFTQQWREPAPPPTFFALWLAKQRERGTSLFSLFDQPKLTSLMDDFCKEHGVAGNLLKNKSSNLTSLSNAS